MATGPKTGVSARKEAFWKFYSTPAGKKRLGGKTIQQAYEAMRREADRKAGRPRSDSQGSRRQALQNAAARRSGAGRLSTNAPSHSHPKSAPTAPARGRNGAYNVSAYHQEVARSSAERAKARAAKRDPQAYEKRKAAEAGRVNPRSAYKPPAKAKFGGSKSFSNLEKMNQGSNARRYR